MGLETSPQPTESKREERKWVPEVGGSLTPGPAWAGRGTENHGSSESQSGQGGSGEEAHEGLEGLELGGVELEGGVPLEAHPVEGGEEEEGELLPGADGAPPLVPHDGDEADEVDPVLLGQDLLGEEDGDRHARPADAAVAVHQERFVPRERRHPRGELGALGADAELVLAGLLEEVEEGAGLRGRTVVGPARQPQVQQLHCRIPALLADLQREPPMPGVSRT